MEILGLKNNNHLNKRDQSSRSKSLQISKKEIKFENQN